MEFVNNFLMRKKVMSIEEAKSHILGLSGQSLKIGVNKGRKKIVRYLGHIKDIYPAVFTLHIEGEKNLKVLSCSYTDVICGQVSLKEV